MDTLTNVTRAADSTSDLPGARLVTDRVFLTYPEFGRLKHVRGFGLCRHYKCPARGLRPVLTDGRPR